jgi:hypothetical protein
MPLPLVPIVVRFGVMAVVGLAARRALATRTNVGRVDQRAEDALDGLGEGLAARRSDLADGQQTNRSLRVKRVIRWGKSGVEIDAAFLGRFRIRRL